MARSAAIDPLAFHNFKTGQDSFICKYDDQKAGLSSSTALLQLTQSSYMQGIVSTLYHGMSILQTHRDPVFGSLSTSY